MKLGLLIAALAACGLAQSNTLTGVVREQPDFNPLAGVNVTMTQAGVVVASSYTPASGEFTFRDLKPGRYGLEYSKPGYTGPRSMEFEVPLARSQPVMLTMYAPGTISGRVEDEEGKPVVGIRVDVGSRRMLTDGEGRFTSEPLIPGSYLAQLVPTGVKQGVMRSFTEADAAVVDYDYEAGYWPGGTAVSERALPVKLMPGGSIDIGVLRPRQIPLYRARLLVSDDHCTEWHFIALPNGEVEGVECSKEYLLTGIPAGRHRIRMSEESNGVRYAVAEAEMGPDARPIEIRFEPTMTVRGRVVGQPGVTLPENFTAQVNIRHLVEAAFGRSGRSGPDHRFTIENVVGGAAQVEVSSPVPYYAAAIRYGGQAVRDGRITLVPGAEMELVFDDKAATISGTYEGGDGVPMAIVLWKPGEAPRQRIIGQDGRFAIRGIPPGEYRIAAVRMPSMVVELGAPQGGQAITLKPGETANVSLKVQ